MVGVAGRSRGCKTCRRARVKCDETRPVCNRCARLKLKCEGRTPHPIFIDGLSLLEIQPEQESGDISNLHDNAYVAVTSVPKALVMDKDNIFLAYLMRKIFPKIRNDNESSMSRWVVATTQTNDQACTSQLAMKALAAAYYGKSHSCQQAIDRGTMLYTRVLYEIRKDLYNPKRVLDTATLASTLLLAMYELITSKDTTGWLTHFLGIGQLVKIRGPFRHQTGIGKELFQTARATIALAHLLSNKRCFLEEIGWKVVPWSNDPDSKNTIDYLLDTLCDMPGIFEDMQLLQDTPIAQDSLPAMWTALELRIKSCMESLYRWRAKWEEAFSNTYYLVELNSLRDLRAAHLETYPLSTAIFFVEPIRATELCLYNSMLVLLHRALGKIPSSIGTTTIPNAPPLDDHYGLLNPKVLLAPGEGSVEEIVCEICRMVYYQLFSYPGSTGALQLMFPLQVAYHNIDPQSRTAEWLSKIISHVADVYGFEAAKYARNSADVAIVV